MVMENKLFAYNFRRLRKEKGWSTQYTADLGEVSKSYIDGVETGHKPFGKRAQAKWALIFGEDYREFHKPIEGEQTGVAVIAYVSAGGGVIPMSADQYPVGNGFEYIESPPGYSKERIDQEGIYAVKVQGDSMYPALKNGWCLYIRPEPAKILKTDDLVIFKDDHETAWVKEIESITDSEIVFRSIGKGPTIIKKRYEIKVIERVFLIKP